MRQHLILAGLLSLVPAALMAQDAPPAPPQTAGDSREFPAPRLVEGQSWDARPPEKADDKPLFPEQTRAPYHKAASYKVTTITDKLRLPWSIAFLPDGKMLVTDLAHAVLDQAGNAVHDVTVIYRGVPAMPEKNFSSKQGGRIVFARDGSLFMTVGDRDGNNKHDYDEALAQKLDNDVGKVIHLAPDGTPSPDNPFLNRPDVRPEIWTYGMRSPQGLVLVPDGSLWETEHGPRGGDELNRIQKGKNYGWPIITHGLDYPGGAIGEGIVARDGLEQPVYYWDPVIAPSGLAYYDGKLFPQWRGNLLAGALRGLGIYRLVLKNNKVVAEEPLLTELHTRIRDVRVGPDGAVYVLTDQKALLKLTPN